MRESNIQGIAHSVAGVHSQGGAKAHWKTFWVCVGGGGGAYSEQYSILKG